MRISITNKQINFYVEHGYIEFEELLSNEDIKACRDEFTKTVKGMDPKTVYLQGRDLWRRTETFSKIAKNKHLSSIANQLVGKTRLRLAFDQISSFAMPEDKPLASFFSVKELACIVVLYLDAKGNSCTFIDPKHPFVPKDDCQNVYLIGYALNKALYIANKQDWNTHYLKKFGYSFGDFLQEEFHPIVS